MFKQKKFTLTFRKAHLNSNGYSWKEVTDNKLLVTLLELKEKFNFDILKTSFKDGFDTCKVTIRCSKEDYALIFSAYCLILGDYIDHISF